MKLLHVSDLHFHRPWFRWVAEHAHESDAVVISGDLLHLNHEVPLYDQIEWVSRWLCELHTPAIVCSGNHDCSSPASRRCDWLPGLAETRGHLTCDRGMMRKGKWTIESVPWGGLPLRGGENHIVVTHAPPAGAPTAMDRTDGQDWGDKKLSRYLARSVDAPWLILSGHVHEPENWRARWKRTWSLNPLSTTFTHDAVPNHIVVDLEAGIAMRQDGWGENSRLRLRV